MNEHFFSYQPQSHKFHSSFETRGTALIKKGFADNTRLNSHNMRVHISDISKLLEVKKVILRLNRMVTVFLFHF